MRNLSDEFLCCIKKFEATGLIPCGNIAWSVNSRAKRWWFKVYKTPDNNFRIQINPHLLNSIVPQEALQSVLCTALIYTLPNCYLYGKTWQAVADMLNETYGYQINNRLTIEGKSEPLTSVQAVVEKVPEERSLSLNQGDFVCHKTHGQGVICEVNPLGTDTILTILFQHSGPVQLMQRACALSMEKIDPGPDRKAYP